MRFNLIVKHGSGKRVKIATQDDHKDVLVDDVGDEVFGRIGDHFGIVRDGGMLQ